MIYSFDKIQINDLLREVTFDGQVINLEPKVYDLIVYFVKKPNQAISKRELQDALWPSLEISETAITRAIMKARKVLAVSSKSKTYIHTIHGHGYKFIADLTVAEPDLAVTTSEQPDTQNGINFKSSIWPILLVSFVAVGLIYLSQINTPKSNDQLLVLPIHNTVEDENLSWVSLGLMSLVSKIIESKSDVWLVPDKDSVEAADLLSAHVMPLPLDLTQKVKQQYNVRYLVASTLSKSDDNRYTLSYELHHDKGIYSDGILQGDNPTALAQLMAKQVADMLPGQISDQNFIVISEDAFTNELYSRGMAFQIEGNADKAQNYFEMAADQDATLFAPKYELAVVKRKQSKLEEAIADFNHLLNNFEQYSQNPTEKIQLLNSVGVTYLRLLDYEKAMANFNQANQLAQKHEQYRMVATTSYNMAIIERRKQNLTEARKWATASLAILKKYKIKKEYSALYLIGQIERDAGNLNKATDLMSTAYHDYVEAGRLRHASSVLNAIANMLKKKGLYQDALNKIIEAKQTKSKLNDKIGLVDVDLNLFEIYMATEQFPEASQLLTQLWQYAREHELKSRYNSIFKKEVALDFAQHQYAAVIEKINGEGADIKSKNLDMLRIKASQQMGDEKVIPQWLEANVQYQSDKNNMLKMYWLDFQNYYLAFHGRHEDLIYSYQQRLALSRLMGNDALSVKLLLKIGYQYLRNEQLNDVQMTLNDILSYDLNWWQIDMFQALLAYENKQQGVDLHELSGIKAKAGSAWQEKYELLLQQMNQNAELVFEEVLLF